MESHKGQNVFTAAFSPPTLAEQSRDHVSHCGKLNFFCISYNGTGEPCLSLYEYFVQDWITRQDRVPWTTLQGPQKLKVHYYRHISGHKNTTTTSPSIINNTINMNANANNNNTNNNMEKNT